MSASLLDLLPALHAHAAAEQPRECCGLALVAKGRLRYWPCRNVAGEAEFAIHPDDQAAAEDAGEVVGVCHSHVYLPPEPSEADRTMCELTRLPWLIVNWPVGTHCLMEPSGYVAPLVGRVFTHGVNDCYTLVRDYYATLQIVLPLNPSRPDNWWHDGVSNLYLDNYRRAGFVLVRAEDDLRIHDVLLMQVGARVPNHAAVMVDDNIILHHCHGRLSSRDVYGGYWRKVTTHVLRHRDLSDA